MRDKVFTDTSCVASRAPPLVSSYRFSFANKHASGSPVRLTSHLELMLVNLPTLLPVATCSRKASLLGSLALNNYPYQLESLLAALFAPDYWWAPLSRVEECKLQ
ncbi:hypothetical protein FOVG_18469 [Fusarium oxysporum f. sp. pisi HDV247]|uniref:Uncharacterized protein n=1 Tax=Fusarium oxysporum f. sp. pisi HDV247 TaxID=1080344 RepID=W9NBR2_FUSOX|nr:hypothetical protein FOVG_18469 [Fusarium oxysporum f. sp. pisi HDV247]